MSSANRVQVILNETSIDTLKLLAQAKKRSVSNLASLIIEEYLESDDVKKDARLIALRQQVSDLQIRSALEGANLTLEKLKRVTDILCEHGES